MVDDRLTLVLHRANHALFHAGQPAGRVFPESSRLPAFRRWCRERQCGLLWGHCWHAADKVGRWDCCMCAWSVNGWPLRRCRICT